MRRRQEIMSNTESAIEFRDVSFVLPGGKTLLAHLNLQVGRGETLVLLGRSGSGKTTTMKLINRLIDPTAGQVIIDGKPTVDWDPIQLRRRIGYVIQEIGLFPHLTIEQNIGVVPRLEGWQPERIHQRAYELLNLVGLDAERFAGSMPRELSGGQRQRVGVARALAADPPVILLDEPFGALDPITRRGIQQEFKALQQNLGKTMVFVTHDIAEAFVLGSRIGLLKDGEMVLLGAPAELLESSHPEARAFAACFHDGQSNRETGVTLLEFFTQNRGELGELVLEHLFLVVVSTGIAVLIGVPLGILLTRRPALSKPILGFANIMQTVPSLALFGFLIPLNIYLFQVKIVGGIGARTAIVALVLYSLLPIIRNTFTGISNVDPAIRDAGRGMGMTDRQLLLQVELPLALGVIIAGVRVATVICVGTATIAAAIDAGGLGRYIFRGLRANDNVLILAGAVPAALIAIAADLLLGYFEKTIQLGAAVRGKSKSLLWASALVVLAVLGGVYFFTSNSGGPHRRRFQRFHRASHSRRDRRPSDRG